MANIQYVGARYVPKFADPVAWDSARSYEPLTIVTYLGTSYTSKVPVPVGIEISNTEYWVATGNYNEQVERYISNVNSLSENVDGLNANFSELNSDYTSFKNDVTAEISKGSTFYHALPVSKRFYVDGVNGDDNNNGTSTEPFKTLQKFIDICNNSNGGQADIRCYITTAGIYNINCNSITGAAIHITGNVDNVVINVNNPQDELPWYGGHANIQNVTITGVSILRFECPFLLNGVNYSGHMELYSGGHLVNVSCGRLSVNTCSARIDSVTVNSNTSPAVELQTSHVRWVGNNTVTCTAENGVGIFTSYSNVMMGGTTNVSADTHYYLGSSMISCSDTTLADIKASHTYTRFNSVFTSSGLITNPE